MWSSARAAHALLAGLLTFLLPLSPGGAQRYREPVDAVALNTFNVTGNGGQGKIPLYANHSLHLANPNITRAVIVIHGRLRNAGTYYDSILKAANASGTKPSQTLLIAPQFLAEVDIEDDSVDPEILHWSLDGWLAGQDALAPAPLSSFEAIDALLVQLADRALFPNLRNVVIAGHSAGAQFVQRYAILGRGEASLLARGVHVRYVAANASSYAYFDALRPGTEGTFSEFAPQSCPKFNQWKYGMEQLPRYAAEAPPSSVEQNYVQRDVVYLLGTNDIDPYHRALDKSCMAEAEGPTRLARGQYYFTYLRMRHPADLRHRLLQVEGVGHNGDRMLTSECGLSVLFDRPGCGSS